jgi:exosortase/archaeosortase family protein
MRFQKLIQSFKTFYQSYPYLVDVALFMLITIVAHELYWLYINLASELSWMAAFRDFMRELLFHNSAFFLDRMYEVNHQGTTFLFPEIGYIEVNNSCTGIKQFYQIFILFLLFPGPWKHKLWYIPLSILIMHLVNVLRIVILGIVLENWPDWWDFSHDWILRPFFYVVIFLLWVIWNEKIRHPLKLKAKV